MPEPLTILAVAAFAKEKAFDKLVDVALEAPLEAYKKRRVQEAREAIVRRVAKGQRWAASEDETLFMMLRICQAAVDGAAIENLDLLAQAIASGHQEPTLVATRFRQWNRVLAELSREEILVLGRYIAGKNEPRDESDPKDSAANRGFNRAVNDLVGPGKPIANRSAIVAHLFALQRTGLVVIGNSWGENYPSPTSLLKELELIVNFDEAIAAAEATNKPSS